MTAPQRPHVDIAELLTALQETSADMAAMSERIASLEASNQRAEEANESLGAELSDLIPRIEDAKATLAAVKNEADRSEALAATHRKRAEQLQTDLKSVTDDLAEIGSAVTSLVSRYGL